jgi:hypothetical protein
MYRPTFGQETGEGTLTILASEFASANFLPWLTIEAFDASGSKILSQQADAVGAARVTLPAGKTTLIFSSPGYYSKKMPLVVTPGLVCRVTVQLLKDPRGWITTG